MAVLRNHWSFLLFAAQPGLGLRHAVRHHAAARHADGRHHDEGMLVPVVRSWAPTNDRGMTLPEVVIAVAILTIGLLAVVGMLSSGFSNVVIGGGESKATSYARQKLEELKNRCYCDATAFPASTGTDAPEAGVTRSWTVTQRSEEHTSELQSRLHLVCRLLLE